MIKIINVYRLKGIKWKFVYKKYRNYNEYNNIIINADFKVI